MPDNAKVEALPPKKAHVEGNASVVFTVTGAGHSVAEIGEILAWIRAALSLSKFPAGVCVSDPVLKSKAISSRPKPPDTDIVADCKIFSTIGTAEHRAASHPGYLELGNCWADLLGNTVYVRGYPTTRRAEPNTGMEISLATMITLARSRRLNRFKGLFCIKGYCSIILPTRRKGDFIYWHLITNSDGKYMSYTDEKVRRLWKEYPQDLSTRILAKSRHILGWCENIQNVTGMYDLILYRLYPLQDPVHFSRLSLGVEASINFSVMAMIPD